LFRVALTLIKMNEGKLLAVPEPLMLFQTLQLIPKKTLDCDALMEACFKKYNDITKLSEHHIVHARKEAREMHRQLKHHQQ
jgi:hypothetical protein